MLDNRPVRMPSKQVLLVPPSKPNLATAIAVEWDILVSNQQALKQHFIPLTSLTSRALNITDEDRKGEGNTRQEITEMLMRYLDTDSLLCWAAEASETPHSYESHVDRTESLREIQRKAAQPII